jgi:hypothetical protein
MATTARAMRMATTLMAAYWKFVPSKVAWAVASQKAR